MASYHQIRESLPRLPQDRGKRLAFVGKYDEAVTLPSNLLPHHPPPFARLCHHSTSLVFAVGSPLF